MKSTPKGFRLHIGLFGRRNAGKSSVLNAMTRQQVSIVSDVAGTTTDPVEKPMELLPLGPVLFIDTAGIDDAGALGEQIAEIDYDFYWKENRTLYHKLVSFYLMTLVQEGAGTRDDEADAVGWFPMGEAWHKLSYLNEKEVLRQAWRILQMARA